MPKIFDISVVIPAKDASRYLEEAIGSVQAQIAAGAIEPIVVDDGSADDTAAIAKRMGCVVLSSDSQGAPAARNIGLEHVRGGLVSFHDADDVMCPGALAAMRNMLLARPELLAVFAMREDFFSPDIQEKDRAAIIPQPAHFGAMAGCALLRREAFDLVGGFDERLRAGDAMDWQLRARAIGLPSARLDFVACLHRLHGGNFGMTGREREYRDYAAILRRRLGI